MDAPRHKKPVNSKPKRKKPPHEHFFNKGQLTQRLTKANVIGFSVLALGVLALLFVGSFAYKKMFSSDDISQTDIDEFKQAGQQQRETRPVNRAAGEKPSEKYKRQKKITEREIRETWETRLLRGRALLEIGKGKYRFIFIPDDRQTNTRFYSNGNYTLQDDIIILKPDTSWGPPKSQTFQYRSLTLSDMPVMASKHKGKLVWQVPEPSAGIYSPPYHPILSRAKDQIVVWSVLE